MHIWEDLRNRLKGAEAIRSEMVTSAEEALLTEIIAALQPYENQLAAGLELKVSTTSLRSILVRKSKIDLFDQLSQDELENLIAKILKGKTFEKFQLKKAKVVRELRTVVLIFTKTEGNYTPTTPAEINEAASKANVIEKDIMSLPLGQKSVITLNLGTSPGDSEEQTLSITNLRILHPIIDSLRSRGYEVTPFPITAGSRKVDLQVVGKFNADHFYQENESDFKLVESRLEEYISPLLAKALSKNILVEVEDLAEAIGNNRNFLDRLTAHYLTVLNLILKNNNYPIEVATYLGRDSRETKIEVKKIADVDTESLRHGSYQNLMENGEATGLSSLEAICLIAYAQQQNSTVQNKLSVEFNIELPSGLQYTVKRNSEA